SVFLYSRRKNVKKEGLLLLYKAEWGIKLIDYVGKKYPRTLKVLSYVSIGVGYLLMITMVYFFFKIMYLYITTDIVQIIKVPPIMPLFPYVTSAFNLGLPPFYFFYFIVVLAVIAITHELAHGIFAARDDIKIKSTGFGFFPFFLPIFLAAFVEPDENQMQKKSKFSQMAVLSAGTFANVLTAILFFFVLWGFFAAAFAPAGVVFNDYATVVVPIAGITKVNDVLLQEQSYEKIVELAEKDLNEVYFGEERFFVSKDLLIRSKNTEELMVLYLDTPAINEGVEGAIVEFDGVEIKSHESLVEVLYSNSPGDEVVLKTKTDEGIKEYSIILEEHPEDNSKPWLGVGFVNNERSGVLGRIYSFMGSFKDPNVYYEPKFDGFSEFIYNLLWWLVLISFSVALINMLPVGMFDGGRFFFLTVWGITGSEKFAKKSFAFVTYLILFLLLVLMGIWFFSLF
ncbi:site-2 protease family protein, partial [Nanoarchaeota archaeon]